MCCCSHPPHTPSMQVTDDAPGRNPIFDHPFNLLACFAQCSCMRNNVCLQKRLLFGLPNCLYPPSLDWFCSTCSVLETLTTARVIVVLSKGCVFGYWMPKKWKPLSIEPIRVFLPDKRSRLSCNTCMRRCLQRLRLRMLWHRIRSRVARGDLTLRPSQNRT